MHNLGYGYRKISKELSLSETAILRYLRELNVSSEIKASRKYPIKHEDFFESIDSERKAYWLGFIYADGSIYGNCLSIHLKDTEENVNLLNRFQEDLGSCYKIEHGIQDSWGTLTKYCKLSVNSSKIVKDLKDKGCIRKKSLVLIYPTEHQVPLEMQRHFIRGYFDGDGSITQNGKFIQIAGTKEFLEGIREFLGVLSQPKHDKRHLDKNVYRLAFGGALQVLRIKDIFYEGATIWLQRKKDRFDLLSKQYNEEIIKERRKYSSLTYQE